MSTQQIFAALFLASATAAMAQTSPAPARSGARRPASTAPKSASAATTSPAANPADNPPDVPSVTGSPKPLYALRYVDIAVGNGPVAVPEKYYTVRYTGWTTDGKKFDSSDDHPGKEPITFPYGAHRVIYGWDTGFEGMHVGGKRRLYIPYQLAYGESGRPPVIPAKADLIFDLELVGMSDTPPAPPPPPAEDAAPIGAPGSTAKPDTTVPPQSTPEDSHPNSPPKTQTTPQTNPQTH